MQKSSLKNCLRFLIIFFFVLSLFGCSQKKKIKKGGELIEPAEVKVTEVFLGEIEETIDTTGTIQPDLGVSVSAEVPGRIRKLFVKEEQFVKKGDKLLEIDSTDYYLQAKQAQAAYDVAQKSLLRVLAGARQEEIEQLEHQLNQAKSNLQNAKEDLKRMAALFQKGAISEQQYDKIKTMCEVATSQYKVIENQLSIAKEGASQEEINIAKAQVKQAEASLNSAQFQVKKCKVISPISGRVIKVQPEVGEMISPGIPLITIMLLKKVKVNVDISDSYSGEIKVGQRAEVRVNAYEDEVFTGYVKKISSAVNPANRTFLVEVELPNPSYKLKAGMFTEVSIYTKRHKNVVLVPREAILETEDKNYVFVVKDKRVNKKEVTLGLERKGKVEITEGVKNKEMVVVSGLLGLKDKAEVKVIQ